MAMIKVYKNGKSLLIPAGAYKTQYAPSGWSLEQNFRKFEAPVIEPINSSSHVEKVLTEDSGESGEDVDDDEDVEYEEVDPEDLKLKPVDELDLEELRILAEYLGVDMKTHKTAKQLRAAIRNIEE